MESKIIHFLYMPLLGLGNYGGYRGERFLRNRIKIIKQFVVPSLLNQTSKNFILWISVRYEDKKNKQIQQLKEYFDTIKEFKTIFSYSGVAFWDDKYPDDVARERLINAIHGSMGELLNTMAECDEVLMTIQPSDDCYYSTTTQETQEFFANHKNIQVFGYKKGYVMDYVNQRLAEWNPATTPPFYTIRFPREIFIDPFKHVQYIGPYKSHEYVKDYLSAVYIDTRGFIVGTHGENISTIFNHPFTGHEKCDINKILKDFGLADVESLKLKISIRKILLRKLPYKWQRKLRYWLGERFYSQIYEFLRS